MLRTVEDIIPQSRKIFRPFYFSVHFLIIIIISFSGQLGHGYGGSVVFERSLSTETSTSTRHSQVRLTVISRSTTGFGAHFVICASTVNTNVLHLNKIPC